jgi:hypothetical protein
VILYIEVHLIVLCCCWCFFARLMHFAAQFSTTVLIKCVQLILLGIWLELGVWHAHSLLCLQLVKYPLDTYCILGYRGYHSIIDSVFERCRLQPFFLWFRWTVSTELKNDEMHLSPFAGALWQIHDLFDLFESSLLVSVSRFVTVSWSLQMFESVGKICRNPLQLVLKCVN